MLTLRTMSILEAVKGGELIATNNFFHLVRDIRLHGMTFTHEVQLRPLEMFATKDQTEAICRTVQEYVEDFIKTERLEKDFVVDVSTEMHWRGKPRKLFVNVSISAPHI